MRFESEKLNEDNMRNAEETHFVFDLTNGNTLGFTNGEEVRYAELSFGSEGMTVLLQISGGENENIQVPFMVLRTRAEIIP